MNENEKDENEKVQRKIIFFKYSLNACKRKNRPQL